MTVSGEIRVRLRGGSHGRRHPLARCATTSFHRSVIMRRAGSPEDVELNLVVCVCETDDFEVVSTDLATCDAV